jgi:hypothetical protein
VGQFTELFNGLENAETKSQLKMKAAKSEKRSLDKNASAAAAPSAKPLQSAKSESDGKKPTTGGRAAAPIIGKRSDPDYRQAPAFVRKDTYKAVRIALLNDERGLNYSELVEELLIAWLADRK